MAGSQETPFQFGALPNHSHAYIIHHFG